MENQISDALFWAFADKLKGIVESEGLTFKEYACPVDAKLNLVSLAFFASQETIVDSIIRKARSQLLSWSPMDSTEHDQGFTFSVYKSFILSNECWDLSFSLTDRYKLIEDYQA